MFPTVYFDITGGCNAKCPLCVTARLTFGKRIEFISVEDFSRAIDRLVELGLADASSCVKLYNWGEPILHPDIKGILEVLQRKGLKAGFSTNASKKLQVDDSSVISEYIFSVPGFSQASYNRIHGLKFDRILRNMNDTITNLRSRGFSGQLTLAYHTYQFNVIHEFEEAQRWCSENSVQFMPYYAYVNDYEVAKQYLKGTLPHQQLKELSQKLMLHYLDETLKGSSPDYECPQWKNVLTIDHKSNVLLCCVVSDENPAQKLGSLFDLSREDILHKKVHNRECGDCLSSGCAYWAHHPEMLPSRDLAVAFQKAPEEVQVQVEELALDKPALGLSWSHRILASVKQSLSGAPH